MPSSRSSSRPEQRIPEEIKAVVFDLDGTLYDNKRIALHLIFSDLPRFFTLKAERQARRELKGVDYGDREALYDAMFKRMAAIRGTGDAAKYSHWFHDVYMPCMAGVLACNFSPRPLVIELVESLHAAGIKVFVYSDYESVPEKLQALCLDPALFDGLLDAPETGGLKPCAAAFGRMLEHFGCEASTTLMVGDREDTDGEGARSVGMPFYNVKASHDAWDELLKHFL